MQVMKVICLGSAVAAIVGLTSLAGCKQQPLETRAVTAASQADVTPLDQIAPEGAFDCPLVCVSDIAKDAATHAGRVAVRGVVSKVFNERRAFTVANIVEGATCCASGCGNDSIPARVPADLYEGEMPKEFERVIMVGEVVPNGESYDFVIEEVWARGEVLLKKRG